jgi:hypothetical protein
MSTESKATILSPATLVPIALVVAVCSPAFGLAMWMQGRFSSLDYGIERLSGKLERLEQTTVGSVTLSEFQAWTEVFSAENPTLKVRSPRK